MLVTLVSLCVAVDPADISTAPRLQLWFPSPVFPSTTGGTGNSCSRVFLMDLGCLKFGEAREALPCPKGVTGESGEPEIT